MSIIKIILKLFCCISGSNPIKKLLKYYKLYFLNFNGVKQNSHIILPWDMPHYQNLVPRGEQGKNDLVSIIFDTKIVLIL